MGRIKNPVTFSGKYHVARAELVRRGAFDPTLNADTRLFIDPLLLSRSRAREIRVDAVNAFAEYFDRVATLLAASRLVGDAPWRAAEKLFKFGEIKETCLGYGSRISGSAFGPALRTKVLRTAAEIVALGIRDPILFTLIPLLEDGIGPDRISDMTTHAILVQLAKYSERIAAAVSAPTRLFQVGEQQCALPINPFTSRPSRMIRAVGRGLHRTAAVLLVPRDILRQLPIATSWAEVADAAAQNDRIRRLVNSHIGAIWERGFLTHKDKREMRRLVLGSRAACESLIEAVREAEVEPYDLTRDPGGHYRWRQVSQDIATKFPLELPSPHSKTEVVAVVRRITDQFAFLIEHRGLWKELWEGGKPRNEHAAQMLFYAVAHSYCDANNLDVTPEADTGSGIVDFKISTGFRGRVVVEVKLSNHRKVVEAYSSQLVTYMNSEKTDKGTYLVVDVGGMGDKETRLARERNRLERAGEAAPEVVVVDAKPRASASKR